MESVAHPPIDPYTPDQSPATESAHIQASDPPPHPNLPTQTDTTALASQPPASTTDADTASLTIDLTALTLKATDRKRLRQRPLYAYWIETYLPQHSSDPPGDAAHMTRDEVVDDLKLFFGRDFEKRYDKQKEGAIREVEGERVWREVREGIKRQGASGREVGRGMKALRKMMLGESEEGKGKIEDGKQDMKQDEVEDQNQIQRREQHQVGGQGQRLDQEHTVKQEQDHDRAEDGACAKIEEGEDENREDVRSLWRRGEWEAVKGWCLENWREVELRERMN